MENIDKKDYRMSPEESIAKYGAVKRLICQVCYKDKIDGRLCTCQKIYNEEI